MKSKVLGGVAILPVVATILGVTNMALADCAPIGPTAPGMTETPKPTRPQYKAFDDEAKLWAIITTKREMEQDSDGCDKRLLTDYAGFPTVKCEYSASDEAPSHDAIPAEVILLDPSAAELTSWSINACRINGASDRQIPTCIDGLRKSIEKASGAQFPVVGSVIESRCNSGNSYTCTKGEPPTAEQKIARQPINAWFRDGVAIDYVPGYFAHWNTVDYTKQITQFPQIFKTDESDLQLSYLTEEEAAKTPGATRAVIRNGANYARISGASRKEWEQWKDWRNTQGQALINPSLADIDTELYGWLNLSREVQKSACSTGINELFNAIVYANKGKWIVGPK